MPWGLLSIICLHCLTGFAYAVDDNSVHALSSLQWNVAVGNSVGNACSPAPSSASETKWIPIDEYFSKKIGQEVSGAASIRVEMSSIPTAQQLLVLPAAALTAYANDREIPIVPSEDGPAIDVSQFFSYPSFRLCLVLDHFSSSIEKVALFRRLQTSASESATTSASESASLSATPSVSPTFTKTSSKTATNTKTMSRTPTGSSTVTISPTISLSTSLSASTSVTPTASETISTTGSVTASLSPTASVTPSVSVTISETPTISSTPTLTATESLSRTVSMTVSLSRTVTETPSETPSISDTASVSPTCVCDCTHLSCCLAPSQTFIDACNSNSHATSSATTTGILVVMIVIPVALVVGLVIAGIAYVVYRSKMKRDRQQQQQGPGTVRREHRQSDAVMPESSSPPPPSSPSGYEPNSDTARVDSRQAAAAVVERPIDEVGDDDGEVNPSPSIEVDLNSDEERAGVTSSPVTSPPISRPVSRQSSSHGAIPIPADELEEGDPPRLGSDAPSVPTPSQESESSSSDADPVEGTSPRVRKVKSGAKKGSSRRRRKSVKPVVVEPPVQPIPYIDSLRPSGSRLDAVISPMFVADLLKNPDFKFTSASPTQPPPQASPATVLKHRKLKPSRLQSDRRSPSPRRSKSPRAPILVNSLPKAALEEDSMDSAFGLGLNQ